MIAVFCFGSFRWRGRELEWWGSSFLALSLVRGLRRDWMDGWSMLWVFEKMGREGGGEKGGCVAR